MMRRTGLLAVTLAVTGCGMLGGGGGSNNTAPDMAPGTSTSGTSGSSGTPSAPRPGGTTPMSPLDYRGGAVPAAAPAAASVGVSAAATGPTLYTRLGGVDAIRAVVHDLVGRIAADDRINALFRGVDIPNLERLLTEQICQATGGPCQYTGRSMRVTHQGMNITDAQFNALVEDLVASLNQFNVPAAERTELVTALATMRGDIVGR